MARVLKMTGFSEPNPSKLLSGIMRCSHEHGPWTVSWKTPSVRRFVIMLLALVLAFSLPGTAWAQDAFPDGKSVPEWFRDVRKTDLASLGKPFVITRHGVRRNSTEVQTEAIQKVIDLAAEKGGVVVIPKGTFISGALHFRPGTHLWIEGTLKGSERVKDFPLATTRIEGQTCIYFPALVNIDGRKLSSAAEWPACRPLVGTQPGADNGQRRRRET